MGTPTKDMSSHRCMGYYCRYIVSLEYPVLNAVYLSLAKTSYCMHDLQVNTAFKTFLMNF